MRYNTDMPVQTQKIKIALLAPFTIRGLDEALKEECKKVSLDAEFYVAEYEKIYDEILSPESGLKKFKPDISFVLVNQVEDKILNIIPKFLENITGTIAVSNVPLLSYSSFGIADFKKENSFKNLVSEFNKALNALAPKESRIQVYDLAAFFSKYGEYNIVDEKLRYLGDIYIKPEFMPKLAYEFMSFIKPLVSKNRKCVVLDLDNTLWGGIVGEDGFNGIQLDTKAPGNAYLEFQKYLLALNKRGIILAIASKNNYDDAIKVIREHPYMQLREENFGSIQINWDDKATQIKRIAQELNIGLDFLVFIDDDQANRELVRQSLPEVLAVNLPEDPALYLRTIKELNDFNTLQITEEDLKRGELYAKQRQIGEYKNQFSNTDDFLNSLDMEVKIEPANDFTIPRIAQLIQKTNQFNLTTKRYSENDVRKFAEDTKYRVYSVNVKDKFADHGLVGVMIIQNNIPSFVIDNMLLSCRVIGRNIENKMLDFIKEEAKKVGAKEIVGEYIPTEKNSVCGAVYPNYGFDVFGENKFRLLLS